VTSTVPCPDCDRTATVLGRFTLPGPDGPAEFLRVRCAGPLTLLVPVAEVRQPVERPVTG
jgi:ribosomal protein S27E